ncbi:MAG: formate dehydrogenase subunit gamma [Gammaproteobacteria bacterium]|nr:formate dehydrogenase subunit gamma [Gammaproteobacteria bacterium]MCP5458601.1 formate dehydrogenase subunit gamma [Gammaproteobacteria bacterium]
MKKINRRPTAGWRDRGKRWLAWPLMGLLAILLLMPVAVHWLSEPAQAQASSQTQEGSNERANYWRAVRDGVSGYTAVQGRETNVLIQNGGENWRSLRQGPIQFYSAWLLAFVIFAAGLMHIINGPQKIEKGRSGLLIPRWNLFERVLHWYVAVLFIVLALTGLSLLYGREVMIPLLGKSGFAAYAGYAKNAHNYLGPFFVVGMLLMIAIWLKFNMPIKADWEWIKSAGGMWGKKHPPAGKSNAGEKLMYWQFVVTGSALIATGLILDFPNFGQTREMMQWSHVIHVVAAVIAIVTLLGHAYMALFGVEGALEGMINGKVDVEWAKQHHDLWYEEEIAKGVRPEPVAKPPAVTRRAEPQST